MKQTKKKTDLNFQKNNNKTMGKKKIKMQREIQAQRKLTIQGFV